MEADGNLLCSYHGWRFDSGGACSDLPYLKPEKQQQRKLCAACRSYPTRVEDGMLWVYPRSGPDAAAEAATTELPLIAERRDPANAGRWQWKIPAGVRDFPCGWDGMVENTLDPAHFCAAHHGTLGNRYTDPQPFVFRTTRTLGTESGFEVATRRISLHLPAPPCTSLHRLHLSCIALHRPASRCMCHVHPPDLPACGASPCTGICTSLCLPVPPP